MTKEEINQMVEQAGFHGVFSIGVVMDANQLEAFARLVAEKERAELAVHAVDLARRAVAKEREACAKICDSFQERDVGMQPAECAGAIRARGQA